MALSLVDISSVRPMKMCTQIDAPQLVTGGNRSVSVGLGLSALTVQVSPPIELVLDIIDMAVIDSRDTSRLWTLNLSLLSHTVRHAVLPRAYEITILEVGHVLGGSTGRTAEILRRETAFLFWLMRDPDAPPRRYIKHLVIAGDQDVTKIEFGSTFPWEFDCLSLIWATAERTLITAGLRPHNVRIFHSGSILANVEIRSQLLASTWVGVHCMLNYSSHKLLYLWPHRRSPILVELLYVFWKLGELSQDGGRDEMTIFRIGDAKLGFHDFSPEVIEDIFAFLLEDTLRSYQLILLCDDGYTYQNRTVDEILHDAAASRPDIDGRGLLRRVYIAGRTVQHPKLLETNPYIALLRLEAELMHQMRCVAPE
ncbi:hypothetical protein BKA62DRAFT_715048 [Auriculariales sp. MPI-PUGE-AT-0066]|nr:hypothetical protein BKA62DRAFT_715048 [Auriculariales sp. MPI-PUGE-AT-0066]